MPGDVVLLPTGIAHILASSPSDPVAGPALAVLHTQPWRDWTPQPGDPAGRRRVTRTPLVGLEGARTPNPRT